MNTLKKNLLVIAVIAVSLGTIAPAHATITPTLSLANIGNNSVQITVSADINSTVTMFYTTGTGIGTQSRVLGTTNSVGILSMVVASDAYGIIPGNTVYVTVNGQQSTTQTWPYTTGNNQNSLYLSQNSISLGVGQTTSVTISGGTGSYFILSNSNVSAVQAGINGSTLSLYGLNSATTATITICSSGTNSCATLLVFPGNTNGGNGTVYFSQNSVSLNIGATQVVTIYGNGGYSLSSNSNSNVVSATLNGNLLTIYAVANGSATLTVCQNGGGCGTVFVTTGGTNNTNGSLSFNQTNPYLSVGQIVTTMVYGGNGSYYIKTNSNSSVANATISGNTLTISGANGGTTFITVCDSTTNNCGGLTVTVAGTNGGSSIYFSQTNPIVSVGQSITLGISGGNGSYYLSGISPYVQSTINGSTLTLTGVANGTTQITVCSSGTGCGTLNITVSGTNTYYPQYGTGYNTYPQIDSISLIAQIQALKAQLAQLQAQAGGCGYQGVGATICDYGNTYTYGYQGGTQYQTYPYTYGDQYNQYAQGIFVSNLTIGSYGNEVAQLQQRLASTGIYAGPVTGYYGALTQAAVRQYQSIHGLPPVGNVGPATRALLNSGQ